MCLGIPGELLETREEAGLRMGRVRFAGITRDVCLDYVPDASAGEYVLVHVGFAISRIDREEAERSYRVLEALGQTDELLADAPPGAGDESAPGRGPGPEPPPEPGRGRG